MLVKGDTVTWISDETNLVIDKSTPRAVGWRFIYRYMFDLSRYNDIQYGMTLPTIWLYPRKITGPSPELNTLYLTLTDELWACIGSTEKLTVQYRTNSDTSRVYCIFRSQEIAMETVEWTRLQWRPILQTVYGIAMQSCRKIYCSYAKNRIMSGYNFAHTMVA